MDALVTDVQRAGAVAGLRGLGRAGLETIALGPGRSAAGLWSRFAAARAVGPDAIRSTAGFVDSIARLSREHGPFVVFPGREEAIDAILLHLEQLPAEVTLPYAGAESLQAIRSKRRLPAIAAEAGFRAPRIVRETTAGELAGSSLPLPSVIKSANPVSKLGSAHPISSEGQLRRVLEWHALPADEPILVQELVRGTMFSLELVIGRDGRVAARFQSQVQRTWPSMAGSISSAVSVAPDEELVNRAAEMLAGIGYWGLAQLDLLDGEAGVTLVDINPRFYLCLPLAIACGVNLPAAWHAVATERVAPTQRKYRLGVAYRWLEGDMAAAARGSPRHLFGPRSRAEAGTMWARDDPLPSMLLASDAVGIRIRRRIRRLQQARARRRG
jgi:predicted ATP-grasp superfamily ATP-dependent carboligase